jgi:hypothetical protein
MTLKLVTAPDQDIIAATLGNDEVIGNKPVSALDEIEHALRFPDTTLSRKEQSDTEYVGK